MNVADVNKGSQSIAEWTSLRRVDRDPSPLPVNYLKPTTPKANSLSNVIHPTTGCLQYIQKTAPYVNRWTQPKITKRQVCGRLLWMHFRILHSGRNEGKK